MRGDAGTGRLPHLGTGAVTRGDEAVYDRFTGKYGMNDAIFSMRVFRIPSTFILSMAAGRSPISEAVRPPIGS